MASPLHVVSVLHVPELVHGPGHVDAVQDRLLRAVPGEQSRRPEVNIDDQIITLHFTPDLEMGPIQARSRGCVASCRYLSNFASSTFIARLVLKQSMIIILHSMFNV